jgi:hypothetical protein
MALGLSPARADSGGETQQTVHVMGSASSVSLDHTAVWAGSIRFVVSTTNSGGGSGITLFKLKAGKTLADVMKGVADEFGNDPALGTRELTDAATFRGLADVVVGTPLTVTENLSPGTYYVVDASAPPHGAPPTLIVKPAKHDVEQDSDLSSQTVVSATSADRFVAPRNWPHEGTYTFRNTSDTLHFMILQPVKKGTTDKQVSDFFASGAPGVPPFARPGPSVGNDVVSPGYSLQVSYDLPEGTYVLLCFVADDVTGMPHAFMGMHKVVVLN